MAHSSGALVKPPQRPRFVSALLTDRLGAVSAAAFEDVDAGRAAFSVASPLYAHVLYERRDEKDDKDATASSTEAHDDTDAGSPEVQPPPARDDESAPDSSSETFGSATWRATRTYGWRSGVAGIRARARRLLAAAEAGEADALGGDISRDHLSDRFSVAGAFRFATLPLRVSGSAAKAVARVSAVGPKRPTWNAALEAAVTVLRSAAQNIPRDIGVMRFFTDGVALPGALLPTGALRATEALPMLEDDDDENGLDDDDDDDDDDAKPESANSTRELQKKTSAFAFASSSSSSSSSSDEKKKKKKKKPDGRRRRKPLEMEWIWRRERTPDARAGPMSFASQVRNNATFVDDDLVKLLNNGESLGHVPVVLYLHGGAFALCGRGTHRELASRPEFRLAVETDAVVVVPEYRRPPDHPVTATLRDAERAYESLVRTKGVDPRRVVLAGDSAGGGLALSLLAALRKKKNVLPAGCVLFSPWVDLDEPDDPDAPCASRNANQKFDFLPRDLIDLFADSTTVSRDDDEDDKDDDDEKSTGTLGDGTLADDDANAEQNNNNTNNNKALVFRRRWHATTPKNPEDDADDDDEFPYGVPILSLVGQCEVLYDQVARFGRRLARRDAHSHVVAWRDMVHVSPVFAALHDVPRQQIRMAAAFARACVDACRQKRRPLRQVFLKEGTATGGGGEEEHRGGTAERLRSESTAAKRAPPARLWLEVEAVQATVRLATSSSPSSSSSSCGEETVIDGGRFVKKRDATRSSAAASEERATTTTTMSGGETAAVPFAAAAASESPKENATTTTTMSGGETAAVPFPAAASESPKENATPPPKKKPTESKNNKTAPSLLSLSTAVVAARLLPSGAWLVTEACREQRTERRADEIVASFEWGANGADVALALPVGASDEEPDLPTRDAGLVELQIRCATPFGGRRVLASAVVPLPDRRTALDRPADPARAVALADGRGSLVVALNLAADRAFVAPSRTLVRADDGDDDDDDKNRASGTTKHCVPPHALPVVETPTRFHFPAPGSRAVEDHGVVRPWTTRTCHPAPTEDRRTETIVPVAENAGPVGALAGSLHHGTCSNNGAASTESRETEESTTCCEHPPESAIEGAPVEHRDSL